MVSMSSGKGWASWTMRSVNQLSPGFPFGIGLSLAHELGRDLFLGLFAGDVAGGLRDAAPLAGV
jgi:hypothetical protein